MNNIELRICLHDTVADDGIHTEVHAATVNSVTNEITYLDMFINPADYSDRAALYKAISLYLDECARVK